MYDACMMYVCRNNDGTLSLYSSKPKKFGGAWFGVGFLTYLPARTFPEVLCTDEEPTCVELVRVAK